MKITLDLPIERVLEIKSGLLKLRKLQETESLRKRAEFEIFDLEDSFFPWIDIATQIGGIEILPESSPTPQPEPRDR